MARSGVGYADIAEAAAQIEGRSQSVTVDAIRQILGTGSRTTIANHLKTWKSQKPSTNHNEIPHELASHVKGLWERLQTTADNRIQEIEQLTQQKIENLQAILEHERIDYQALDKKLKETEVRYLEQVTQTEKFRDELSQSDQHNAKLETYNNVVREQIQQLKEENDRLHKINSRLQDNLENIQSELLKSQQDHDQTLDKQRISFSDQIQHLQKSNMYLTDQVKQLDIEKIQLMNECNTLKDKIYCIEQINQQDKSKMDELLHDFINLQARYQTTIQEINIAKQELKEKSMITIELERKNAVIDEQVFNLKSVIQELELAKQLLATKCKEITQDNMLLREKLISTEKI